MLLSKKNISALTLAVATAQALPPQYAHAQTAPQQGSQSPNEVLCRTQMPKSTSSVSTLNVYLGSCMQAWNATKKADLAWYASFGQLNLALHYSRYQKIPPANYLSNAATLAKTAQQGGYDIKTLWDAGIEVEKEINANTAKYGAPKSQVGTDNSLEAKCVYGQPSKDASLTAFNNWTNTCRDAYNQNNNPMLGVNYAAGLLIRSAEFYGAKDFTGAHGLLAEVKRFESYADRYGWSYPALKEAISNVDQENNKQLALQQQRQQESQRQAAAVQEQERQRQIAQQQQQSQQPKSSGLSDGDKAALVIGGALLLALIFGGSSSSKSSGSNSSSSGSDAAIEFERQQQREREMRSREQQPRSEPEPRSRGFYGNCPAPGMGYGC